MNKEQEREELLRQVLKAQGKTLPDERIKYHISRLMLRIGIYKSILGVGRLLIATGLSLGISALLDLPMLQGTLAILGFYVMLKHEQMLPKNEHVRELATMAAAEALKEGAPDTSSQDSMINDIMDKLMDRAAREVANDPGGPKA